MAYSGGFLVYWLIVGTLFGLLGLRIWTRKGGSAVLGFVVGFFLGLIGILILAVMRGPGVRPAAGYQPGEAPWGPPGIELPPQPPRIADDPRWTCPYCSQFVLQDAQKCGACGNTLPLRSCPTCSYNMLATSETCGACMKKSEAWKLHNGRWWKRERGVVYVYDTEQQSWKAQA